VASPEVRGILAVFGGGSQGAVIKPATRHEASPQELVISRETKATQASTMSTCLTGHEISL